jgi:hypothetical protein
VFLAVFTALVGALHAYLWQRLVRAPDFGAAFTRIGTRAVIGLGLLLPLGMVAARVLPRSFASAVVSWASYIWFGVAVVLFFLLLGSEIIRGAVHAAHAWAAASTPSAAASSPARSPSASAPSAFSSAAPASRAPWAPSASSASPSEAPPLPQAP